MLIKALNVSSIYASWQGTLAFGSSTYKTFSVTNYYQVSITQMLRLCFMYGYQFVAYYRFKIIYVIYHNYKLKIIKFWVVNRILSTLN